MISIESTERDWLMLLKSQLMLFPFAMLKVEQGVINVDLVERAQLLLQCSQLMLFPFELLASDLIMF